MKDFFNNEVKAGDWMVLVSSSSNMHPFRFIKIHSFGASGKPRGACFEFFSKTMRLHGQNNDEWGQATYRLCPITVPEKGWVISEEMLPDGLKDYILNEYQGDPFFKVKKK